MSEAFFSEQWYRVAPLRPRLAPGLKVERHRYGGWPWYVLKDPVTGKSHRLSPHAYALIDRLDGRTSVAEAWEDLGRALGPDTPSQDDVLSLIGQMHGADVLLGDVPPDIAEMMERRRKQDRQLLKQNMMGPMSFRVPLFDPDRLLRATLPLVRWAIGPLGVGLWLALMVVSLAALVREWDEVTGAVTDQLFSAGNLALIALAYVPIKLLHEFGHGWVARRYGAEVHETGVMFLVFMPVPYVEASAAAALRSKWQRIFVSAAGIMVETTLAAIAFLIWREMDPGPERALLFNVMLIGGISTVLVNGNPLLRFDGYFVLADLLEMPNLAQRANAWWAEHWQRLAYGAEEVVPKPATRGEALAFFLYAPAAFVYRLVISATIAVFLVGTLFVLGVVFAIWSFFNVLFKPLGKAFWTLATGPRLHRVRGRAWAVTALMAGAVAALLFAVPVPWATRTQGVVWLPGEAALRAETEGRVLAVQVPAGAPVGAGQVVAVLENPLLAARAEVLEARVDELRLALARVMSEDRARARIVAIELAAEEAALARARAEIAGLVLRAGAAGRFEPAMPPEDMQGRFLMRGGVLGHAVPEAPQAGRVGVGQGAIDAVRDHMAGVSLRLPERPGQSWQAGTLRAVPAGDFDLPSPVLGRALGGPVVVDPSEPGGTRALERVFQFEAALPEGMPARFGGRVHVRIDHGTRPLGLQLHDWARRVLLRGLDV
ncbi:MAG: PqqD family peptide modification chaperone [Rhodobacteraceae bacterium]|nr:PqqD family peptide modification chaperone [Paracoccaceae bacterium]